jgi:hypothetical protein
MNITWEILKLEYIGSNNGLENVISNVRYRCTVEETVNEVVYTSYYEDDAILTNPDPNNFTPLDNVTKEQVISWIEYTPSYMVAIQHMTNDLKIKQKPQTVEVIFPFGT